MSENAYTGQFPENLLSSPFNSVYWPDLGTLQGAVGLSWCFETPGGSHVPPSQLVPPWVVTDKKELMGAVDSGDWSVLMTPAPVEGTGLFDGGPCNVILIAPSFQMYFLVAA